MIDDLEIRNLCGVYEEMNPVGKRKMSVMAEKLLNAQNVMKPDGHAVCRSNFRGRKCNTTVGETVHLDIGNSAN